MSPLFPAIKYLAGTAPFVIGMAGRWLGGYLEEQSWWPSLPWDHIITAGFALVVGMVYADLVDPGSRLRLWWQWRRRVATVQFHPTSSIDDGGPHYNVPRFQIDFTKRASCIGIELVVYRNVQFAVRKPPQLIKKIDPRDYSEGERFDMQIALIDRDGGHRAFWGDDPNQRITNGTGNLVEVRLVSSRRWFPILQRDSVFISYGEMKEVTGNRYFYLQEDRRVFVGH